MSSSNYVFVSGEPIALANDTAGTRVYRSVNQTISAQTEEVVEFDSVSYDNLDAADLSNNRLTAPSDGTYLLAGAWQIDDAAELVDLDAQIWVNGAKVTAASVGAIDPSSSLVREGPTVADAKRLASGDTVQLRARYNPFSGGSYELLGGDFISYLYMVRVSR